MYEILWKRNAMPKKKKKSKFKKPRAGMRSVVPRGKVGYVGVRYHKNYVYDQLRYTVLTVSQMSEQDKHMVQASLKTITTGPEAMVLPDGVNGWACVTLDLRGRAFLLSYKGIEVALFYKRQLTEIKLEPGDRFPEGVCQDPNEAWQRLDIIGLSAKKANLVITTQHKRIENENKILSSRTSTQQELIDALEKENKHLKESKDRLAKVITELNKKKAKRRK